MDRGAGWARVARRLRHHEVVRYDRRGYGRSAGAARDGAWGFAGHLADLREVIEATAGDRPVVAVGHSYGGLLALGAAAGRGRRVAAVASYEAPLPWEPWWPSPEGYLRDDPEALAERFLVTAIGEAAWQALPEGIRRARRAEGRALLDDLDGLASCPPALATGAVAVPVVLGVGGATTGRHRRAVAVAERRWRPRATVEVPGATHAALRSHPDEVAELVALAHRLAGGADQGASGGLAVDGAGTGMGGSGP
jgi:pimeloyl-ACP methyl ester carboxylesterase